MRPIAFLLLGLSSVAAAQPGPSPAPPPPPPPDTTPAPPEPTPAPAPAAKPAPAPVAVVEHAPTRPEGTAFALGVGYSLPISLLMPNTTSARLRLSSGLTFEPAFAIANSSTTMGSTTTTDMSTKDTELSLEALVRFPIISHGKVDLEVLGGLGFRVHKTNPEGDYNTKTVNDFSVQYGLAVGYWITPHWQFSLSTLNALVDYSQTKTQTGPADSTTESASTVGVIFSPSVMMMIHLYN